MAGPLGAIQVLTHLLQAAAAARRPSGAPAEARTVRSVVVSAKILDRIHIMWLRSRRKLAPAPGVGFHGAMARLIPSARSARGLASAALDLILPPQCLACGVAVDGQGDLCAACWARIRFVTPPYFGQCGYPFDFDPGAHILCAACTARRPVYDRARAVLIYDDASRDLVLRFKHLDRTDFAPSFGAWLARAGAELWRDGGGDLIVPVPLHPGRLLRRRYNQAALIAWGLGRAIQRPVAADLLRRLRPTPSQGRLSPGARRRNVRAAFAVTPAWRDRVADGHVLLVDDVLTTGATVEACARTLRRAGAARIDVLTIARVVQPRPAPI